MTETPRSGQTGWRTRLLRVVSSPFVLCVAAILWLEEWLWDPLADAMQTLGRLPLLRSLEALIRRAPPRVALAWYALPVLVLLPFKFVGLYLLTHAHRMAGICVFIGAKLVGTAVAARLFALTRQSLLKLAWFARLYAGFIALRTWVYAGVRRNHLWRLAALLHLRAQRGLRRLFHPRA